MTLQDVIFDLESGNHEDARKCATGFTHQQIFDAAHENGHPAWKAKSMADYLTREIQLKTYLLQIAGN